MLKQRIKYGYQNFLVKPKNTVHSRGNVGVSVCVCLCLRVFVHRS